MHCFFLIKRLLLITQNFIRHILPRHCNVVVVVGQNFNPLGMILKNNVVKLRAKYLWNGRIFL
jgi:hypothetical protein